MRQELPENATITGISAYRRGARRHRWSPFYRLDLRGNVRLCSGSAQNADRSRWLARERKCLPIFQRPMSCLVVAGGTDPAPESWTSGLGRSHTARDSATTAPSDGERKIGEHVFVSIV